MTGAAVFDRITFEPGKMGGRACSRRMRITVSTIVGLGAEGETAAESRRTSGRPLPTQRGSRAKTLAYAARLTREEVIPA